jgi:hypothetical protein
VFDFLPRTWPGSHLSGLPFRAWIDRPIEIGVLSWPTGASRFACYHGIVDSVQLAAIRSQVFVGSAINPLPLVISDGLHTLTASMWMLPPRPLAAIPGTVQQWLLTLVDDRFGWWFKSAAITVGSSWTGLISSIASALGVSIAVDPIPAAYLTPPAQLTQLYESLPVLLDAVAASVGLRIVRRYDGTVLAQNAANGLSQAATNQIQSPPWPKRAGGVILAADLAAALPASVTVAFGGKQDYTTSPTLYAKQVSSTLAAGVNGVAGLSKPIHSTAEAANAGTPSNQSELDALAVQIATDWYAWQMAAWDIVYHGPCPWVPESQTDVIEFTHRRNDISTRVMRGPWNDWPDVLYHKSSVTESNVTLQQTEGATLVPVGGYYGATGVDPIGNIFKDGFLLLLGTGSTTIATDSAQINTTTPIYPFNRLNLVAGPGITLTMAADTPSAGVQRVSDTITCTGGASSESFQINTTTPIYSEPLFNLVAGTNVTLAIGNDTANTRVSVTISATAGAESFQVNGNVSPTFVEPILDLESGNQSTLTVAMSDDTANTRVRYVFTAPEQTLKGFSASNIAGLAVGSATPATGTINIYNLVGGTLTDSSTTVAGYNNSYAAIPQGVYVELILEPISGNYFICFAGEAFQHNGSLVAAQPILNFGDDTTPGGTSFTLTNDNTNHLVTVQASSNALTVKDLAPHAVLGTTTLIVAPLPATITDISSGNLRGTQGGLTVSGTTPNATATLTAGGQPPSNRTLLTNEWPIQMNRGGALFGSSFVTWYETGAVLGLANWSAVAYPSIGFARYQYVGALGGISGGTPDPTVVTGIAGSISWGGGSDSLYHTNVLGEVLFLGNSAPSTGGDFGGEIRIHFSSSGPFVLDLKNGGSSGADMIGVFNIGPVGQQSGDVVTALINYGWLTSGFYDASEIVGAAGGGDLAGSYPNPVVAKIQTVAVSAAAPSAGQALVHNGTQWTPTKVGTVVAAGDLTGQTGAVAGVTSFTSPASNGTYRVGGYVTITAIAVDALNLQVSYTDETSVVRTQTFFMQGLTSANLATVGAFTFPTMDIRVKASTTITILTTLAIGGGTLTYDVGGTIEQLR